jgi:indolepyruvate ferredoxin oxidoreductase beta subunit
MKKDVILAGVGGQGLLSIAAVIAQAAHALGLNLKQAEVHGMAQRGGVVQSHVRISDRPLHSDLIWEGRADLILATEPMEALRYLSFLSPEGMLVANAVPFKNIEAYPAEETIRSAIEALPHHLLVDAVTLAKDAGSIRCANMVILGAGAPFLDIPAEALREAIVRVFQGKAPEVIETNLRGFEFGLKRGQQD